jgi:DNA-binding NarL/FixJ family response regulator
MLSLRAWGSVESVSSIRVMEPRVTDPDFRFTNHDLGFASLTSRERQVLERAAEGQTNAQVAAALGVTTHAVKFHLSSVFRKLSVKNRTEATSAYWRQADGRATKA